MINIASLNEAQYSLLTTSIKAVVQRTKQAYLWYSGPSCLLFHINIICTPVLLTKRTNKHELCNSWGRHCELPSPNSTYSPGGGLSNNPRHLEVTTGQRAGHWHSLGGRRFRTPGNHFLCCSVRNCHTTPSMVKPSKTRAHTISDWRRHGKSSQRSKASLGRECADILHISYCTTSA
jgi:hypothetical protein